MKTVRIAILGGGLAGLSAAYFLRKIGMTPDNPLSFDVRLFEASEQLGCDLPSRRNFLMADNERELFNLARELNVAIEPLPTKPSDELNRNLMKILVTEILWLRSKRIIARPVDWAEKDDPLLNKLDQMTIIEFLVKKGMSLNEARLSLTSSLMASYTTDFDRLSALDALRFIEHYVNVKTLYQFSKGVNAFNKALIDSVNENQQSIFINAPVRSVDAFENKWSLVFVDGSVQMFDYVVMADPNFYQKQNDTLYFQCRQRDLIRQYNVFENGLFYSEEFVTMDAPSSMNSAIKSSYNTIKYSLFPAIYGSLESDEVGITSTVDMAVFTSGNDPRLDSNLS